MNNLRLQNVYNSDDKFGSNSRKALFVISGNKSNMGEVLCINNEVSELLGYERNEIVGHNISIVMPPCIGEKHSEMIINSFSSGKAMQTNDNMVLPLHKSGYIIPSCLIHRIVPNLQNGLQLIGFLFKIQDFSKYCSILERGIPPDDVTILLADESWKLLAFNIRASKIFGINPIQGNLRKYVWGEEKISVLKLIPELSDPNFEQKIQKHNAAEINLQLKTIRKIVESEIETFKNSQGNENQELDFELKIENDY